MFMMFLFVFVYIFFFFEHLWADFVHRDCDECVFGFSVFFVVVVVALR